VIDGMTASRWFLLACFAVSTAASLHHLMRVLVSFRPHDPAKTRGSIPRAVAYSLTLAMSPARKESARRHVPTYALGLVFHGGIAVAFVWLAIFFAGVSVPADFAAVSVIVLAASTAAGLALLVKRATRAKLRHISTPDDYFSNALLAGFEVLAIVALLDVDCIPFFLMYGGVLLLYVPLGKLRHALYFVFARVYLGLFFGKRGVWGQKGNSRWRAQNR